MKYILAIVCLIAACAAQAQTTTNLDFRVRVEVVTAGSTNTTTTNFRYDYGGTQKDTLKIKGLAFGYAAYLGGGGTNDFGKWLKQEVDDHARAYQNAKQQADYSVLLGKIQTLLLTSPDLLNASDLSSLQTIAAKAP